MEIMPALEDTSSATTRVHPPLTRHFLLHARREPLLELFVLIDLAVQSPVE